jgi:hypothetical protein
MAILFTGMFVLMSFASKMCFGLIDIGQRGLKGKTPELRIGEALSTIIHPWDFFFWFHYSKEMDMSGKPCIQNFSGGHYLGSVGCFVRDRTCYLLYLKC